MGFKALSLSFIVLVGQSIWTVAADGGPSYCYRKSNCGPSTWSGTCRTGSNQSPIDIPYNRQIYDNSKTADLSQNNCYFQRQSFILKNSNGHTAQVELRPDQTSSCVLRGTLVNGNSYVFSNMHFHWGSQDNQGSEHTVNGRRFVMEGHLVHYRSDFKNLTQAVASGDPNALTVIGVNFYIDENNREFSGLAPIVRGLRSVRSSNAKTQGSDIRLADFLFQSQERNVGVIQYDGSLTTPGCSEAVLWNVLAPPCPISRAQLQEFRNLLDEDGNQLVDNYRPTQELNNRAIRYYRSSIWY